jgi:hypothetical protein
MHVGFSYAHPGWALGPAKTVGIAVQEFMLLSGYLSPIGGCQPASTLLLWRSDAKVIYMLPENVAGIQYPYQMLACLPIYEQFPDTWQPGQPNNEDLTPPQGYVVPRFGIGKVWREHFYNQPDDKLSLYWPQKDETHVDAMIQEFENATIMYLPDQKVFYTLFPGFPHPTPDGSQVVDSPVWFVIK